MYKTNSNNLTLFLGYLAPLCLATLLGACTTEKQPGLIDAATTPLSDLNILQEKIPPALFEAHIAPYAVPPRQSCAALDTAIKALDKVLEPDVDTPNNGEKPDIIERGANKVGEVAINTLRSTAEGVVPFRGWLRKLTGAERHSKQVAAAIAAGIVRRAFLKGIKATKECPDS